MVATTLYAGILALGFALLSVRVIRERRSGVADLGDGGDVGMLRKIRAHANFAEYVPLILVLMALVEAGSASPIVVHAIGCALVLGRILHGYAFSFSSGSPVGRVAGTALTLSALLGSGTLCLAQAFQQLS